jgi:hypothetical protein
MGCWRLVVHEWFFLFLFRKPFAIHLASTPQKAGMPSREGIANEQTEQFILSLPEDRGPRSVLSITSIIIIIIIIRTIIISGERKKTLPVGRCVCVAKRSTVITVWNWKHCSAF